MCCPRQLPVFLPHRSTLRVCFYTRLNRTAAVVRWPVFTRCTQRIYVVTTRSNEQIDMSASGKCIRTHRRVGASIRGQHNRRRCRQHVEQPVHASTVLSTRCYRNNYNNTVEHRYRACKFPNVCKTPPSNRQKPQCLTVLRNTRKYFVAPASAEIRSSTNNRI